MQSYVPKTSHNFNFACSEKWMLNDIGGSCKLVVPGRFSLTYLLFIISLIKDCLQCVSLPIPTTSVSFLFFFFNSTVSLFYLNIVRINTLNQMHFQRNSDLKQSGRKFQARKLICDFGKYQLVAPSPPEKRQKSFPESRQSTFFFFTLKC